MNIEELEDCITCYGKDVYAFCRQLTYNKEDAEELYQDTFLMTMKKLAVINRKENPKSYLLSVCLRLWKNKKRKYAWRQRIAGMESLTEEKNDIRHTKSLEESVLEKEKQQMVREAINCLDERYRIPVYLYYLEELSLQEIAEILKIPKGTVKSRLHKARGLLKERLEREYE